jgi:hypothetical protein
MSWTNKQVCEDLEQLEDSGAGFWHRNSDGSITVFVRGAHGNDPMQWEYAHRIVNHFGSLAGMIQPDAQSGHLTIKLRKVM